MIEIVFFSVNWSQRVSILGQRFIDFHQKCCMVDRESENSITGETVEKVLKQVLGGDAEKNDFTECATINDLTITKGLRTPKNRALTILKGFSTVSEEITITLDNVCIVKS